MSNSNKTSLFLKCSLNIENPTSLSLIASQLQTQSSHVLCVIDGSQLVWFNNRSAVPDNIIFQGTAPIGDTVEYSFKEIGSNKHYSVYGKKAALLFYPLLESLERQPIPVANISDLPLNGDYMAPTKIKVMITDQTESESTICIITAPISKSIIRRE